MARKIDSTQIKSLGDLLTAGEGIAISPSGLISVTSSTEIYNTLINGGQDYTVTSNMAGVTFNSAVANDRFILRSLHITNISGNTAYISSNVLYNTSNTAYLANLLTLPQGSAVEFMNKSQILQPGDKINLQGFNQFLVPANNLIHSYFTYQSVGNDATYTGTGQTITAPDINTLITSAAPSDLIIESIKIVNLQSYPIPVKTYIGYSNATPKAYLAFNMQVPQNASLELLQAPKILKYLDNIYFSYSGAPNNSISVFVSYRIGNITNSFTTTTTAVAGGSILGAFATTLVDGTTLYYTVE